jgi:hypothetical protein
MGSLSVNSVSEKFSRLDTFKFNDIDVSIIKSTFCFQSLIMEIKCTLVPASADSWCVQDEISSEKGNYVGVRHTFAWIIDRFVETRETTVGIIRSGTFKIKIQECGKEEVTTWRLLLQLKHVGARPDEDFQILLVKEDGPEVRANCRISFNDIYGDLLYSCSEYNCKFDKKFQNIEAPDLENVFDDPSCFTASFNSARYAYDETEMKPWEHLTILCEVNVFHRVTEEITASTHHQQGSETKQDLLADNNQQPLNCPSLRSGQFKGSKKSWPPQNVPRNGS